MYIYNYGAIGKAVRAKIDGNKEKIRGGGNDTDSFGEILKTYLDKTETEKKAVSATGGVSGANSDVVLYALQNSGTDSAASAVLSALGYNQFGVGSDALKSSADKISDLADGLIALNSSDAQNPTLVYDFVSGVNQLNNALTADGGASAYLYKNALSALLASAEESLAASGITFEDGALKFSGTGEKIPDSFLNAVSSSAKLISAYAAGKDKSTVTDYYSAMLGM